MLIGYARTWPSGPSGKTQVEALVKAGVDRNKIWIDHSHKGRETGESRDLVLRSLRSEDELLIYSPGALASNTADAIAALVAASRKGCVIRNIQTGKAYSLPPETFDLAEFVEDVERDLARLRTGPARAKAKPRRPSLAGEKLAAARVDWKNTNLTMAECEDRHGISRQTFYRHFGGRKQ